MFGIVQTLSQLKQRVSIYNMLTETRSFRCRTHVLDLNGFFPVTLSRSIPEEKVHSSLALSYAPLARSHAPLAQSRVPLVHSLVHEPGTWFRSTVEDVTSDGLYKVRFKSKSIRWVSKHPTRGRQDSNNNLPLCVYALIGWR